MGATAVGKTSLSLRLANELDGEIVSADSRLFYKGMDIGTAKPDSAARKLVPHHLIDICDPHETLTLADYQQRAYQAIRHIQRQERLPILVGGTGQYVKAVIEGWGIPRVPPRPELRKALATMPGAELARWLAELDPAAAEKLEPRNIRRIIRALEVTLVKGRPISDLQRKKPQPWRIAQIGLTCDRETLYQRIDKRVEEMMTAGLLAEVKRLREAGYDRLLPALSGLGYKQLWGYLEGELSLAEAIERIKFDTHRFARQQATWFRNDDPAITWFDLREADVETAVLEHVCSWLSQDSI